MADDPEPKMPEDRDVYADIPASRAIVKDAKQAQALARKMAGEELPDECRFNCVTCGWDKTLQFDDDEIAALGGDITSYTGPCPKCGSSTLIPHAALMGKDIGNIYANAKKQRMEEFQDQADVFVDRVKEELGKVMGPTVPGSMFDGGLQEPAAGEVHDPSGHNQQFPDAGDVDTDDLEPRK